MNLDSVNKIVEAVLYEGYILYPYRPSVKNRHRWIFGGLFPADSPEVCSAAEPATMQVECLLRGNPNSQLSVTIRFLHIVQRRIGRLAAPVDHWTPAAAHLELVESAELNGRILHAWQEAAEQCIEIPSLPLAETLMAPRRVDTAFAAEQSIEPLRDADGRIPLVLVRNRAAIQSAASMVAHPLDSNLFRLRITVSNHTPMPAGFASREHSQLRSMASTHVILQCRDGQFISATDPPADCREPAADCRNIGAWPVLVGPEGSADTVLASPVILYDHPQVAPESPGNFFDGTEIDEILSLRVLTLTDEEKRHVAGIDPRAATMLERTENLTAEQLSRLHGTLRPASIESGTTAHE